MASRTYGNVTALLRKAVAVRILYRELSAVAQPQSEALGATYRKHRGVTNMKTQRLPDELQRAALTVIHDRNVAQLSGRALSLINYLWSRKRAPEDSALRDQAKQLEMALWEKARQAEESGAVIDEALMETQIRRQVLSTLKKHTYHWSPMRYDEETGVVYMAARLAGGYAALRRVFNEIYTRDPSFHPHSLLDFGSGLGTAVWASHSFWGDSLKEMVCVDSSGPMNTLAERLLRGGSECEEPHIKEVYFRQFLPVSPQVQFDLVVGAFSLSELPSRMDRVDTALTMWRKTSSYLVLVENGTREGHQILMEARDAILQKQDKSVLDARSPSVFAPCTHAKPCPKMAQEKAVPCNFLQFYHPLQLRGNPDRSTEKFSYLIMSRSDPAETEGTGDGFEWGRLVAPVLRRSRHVHCHVCCPSGELKHMVVTASKHSKDVYRCARSSDWGDRIPVIQKEEDAQEETRSDLD